MTLIVMVGRRVPRNWFRRTAHKAAGFVSFQENLWLIIKQSMNKAKRRANASGKLTWVMTSEREKEDLHYEIEWLKIIIRGSKEDEEDEYKDALNLYTSLGKILKKEIPKDERMLRHFKTKMLGTEKIEEAYKKGYGAASDNNIANKMLEMGILTHIDWQQDFDTRDYIPEK